MSGLPVYVKMALAFVVVILLITAVAWLVRRLVASHVPATETGEQARPAPGGPAGKILIGFAFAAMIWGLYVRFDGAIPPILITTAVAAAVALFWMKLLPSRR